MEYRDKTFSFPESKLSPEDVNKMAEVKALLHEAVKSDSQTDKKAFIERALACVGLLNDAKLQLKYWALIEKLARNMHIDIMSNDRPNEASRFIQEYDDEAGSSNWRNLPHRTLGEKVKENAAVLLNNAAIEGVEALVLGTESLIDHVLNISRALTGRKTRGLSEIVYEPVTIPEPDKLNRADEIVGTALIPLGIVSMARKALKRNS
ncbi:MAG: hypothetical protein US89_C0007G0047 [Candidatus Peregrinibacteria bacterium GW2011_GWF2_38_29]|nr:MAG: hypothetical protein US89_C0007G0047 [Candidatus Peregrinibacteria bacterium GW2011_GWF2_38_29]HBB02863.1 hypothetical protein [Candidatus Peregrinibacteria bacterium]